MIRNYLTKRMPPRGDDGIAVIMVLIFSISLLLLTLVLTTAAINVIRTSDASEKYYEALAAAEAGLDDYLARMILDDEYYLADQDDDDNRAMQGFVDVPGGTSTGEFTYVVDDSAVDDTGAIIVTSTGRSGTELRTIQSVLRRPSALQYSYFTSIENYDPYLPGAYADPAAADATCNRYYWEPDSAGNYRPGPPTCQINVIGPEDDMKNGKMHTNDVWYIDPSVTLSDSLPTGNSPWRSMTSSCPTTPQGAASVSPCSDNHMWLGPTGAALTPADRFSTAEPWNPDYAGVQQNPSINTRLSEVAEDGGCVFFGPTRIRFFTIGDEGYMAITSPNTRATNPYCGGTQLASTSAAASDQPIFVMKTARVMGRFNGVIYIRDVPAPGDSGRAYPAGSPTDNKWTAGNEPTCVRKGGGGPADGRPFVIPDYDVVYGDINAWNNMDLNDGDWNNFSDKRKTKDWTKGFPSATSVETGWYDCKKGDLFLQGELTGQITIGTANNIALTGHTMYADSKRNGNPASLGGYGAPATKSENILGLVANNFIYNYNPVRTTDGAGGGTKVTDWMPQQDRKTGNSVTKNSQEDVVYNFVGMALNHCFATQNWMARGTGSGTGTTMTDTGHIILYGSIGQKFSCPVGYYSESSGTVDNRNYQRYIFYDRRLEYLGPPFLTTLNDAPWVRFSVSETNQHIIPAGLLGVTDDGRNSQTIGTSREWNVLANDSHPDGLELRLVDAKVTAGQGSVTVTESGNILFDAPGDIGDSVIRYTVTDGSFHAYGFITIQSR